MHRWAGFIETVLIAAIVVLVAASPVRAQTYDPSYPVCLQVYDADGGYISCSYTSMAQCQLSASGRGAQCMVNPYFAGGPVPSRINRRPY